MNFKKVLISLALFSEILNFNCYSNVSYAEGSQDNAIVTCDSLKDYEHMAMTDISNRLGFSEDVDIESILSFKVSEKDYCLVPLCNCEEHVNCFLRLFVGARREYMQYYLDGNLMKPENVRAWVKRSVNNMNVDQPKSLTFLIRYCNEVIGRIGVGPLRDRGVVDTELGYALEEKYAGQHITSNAVKTVLSFLQLLKDKGASCYDFSRIRATADVRNTASNRILSSNNFVKSEKTINVGNSKEENEYFFEFDT